MRLPSRLSMVTVLGIGVLVALAGPLAKRGERAWATFPGENGKIAYYALSPSTPGVFTIEPDGTGVTDLTNHPLGGSGPAWSSDGLRVAFARFVSGNQDVYVMNADGSEQTRLTTDFSGDASPAWSPDGSQVAFMSHRDGDWEIYVMNADGSGQTNITNAPQRSDMNPDWSPDGTRVAFSGESSTLSELYTVNADGSDLAIVTETPIGAPAFPTWAPDGTRLAFALEAPPLNIDVAVVDAAGGAFTNLTQNPARVDSYPAWSPDGTKIAFVSTRDGSEEIYLMNADGSNQTRLAFSSALEAGPAWQPLIDSDSDQANDYEEVFVHGTDGSTLTPTTTVARMARRSRPNRSWAQAAAATRWTSGTS